MPANPDIYAEMLGEKLDRFNTNVYLINTGWTGGPYGKGKRIDITWTRKMIDAAFSGDIEKENLHHDQLFHLDIPENCPGIPSEILFPRNTWNDKNAYDRQAVKLAQKFSNVFNKNYGNKIKESIRKQCPGK